MAPAHQRIILIGPIAAGKSTVANLLSKKLSLERHKMDVLRYEYYKEIGYLPMIAEEICAKKGFSALCNYWKPFDAYAVGRVVEDYDSGIIDFGGGLSVYEDEKLFEIVKNVLLPLHNIILLLPSSDKDESEKILAERLIARVYNFTDFEERRVLNKLFLYHKSNYELAKIIIYTKDKTPEQTCLEIINVINP